MEAATRLSTIMVSFVIEISEVSNHFVETFFKFYLCITRPFAWIAEKSNTFFSCARKHDLANLLSIRWPNWHSRSGVNPRLNFVKSLIRNSYSTIHTERGESIDRGIALRKEDVGKPARGSTIVPLSWQDTDGLSLPVAQKLWCSQNQRNTRRTRCFHN